MKTYRLIQDTARTGAMNMAIDEALLRQTEQDRGESTTLRLYTWQEPTVSCGYAQRPEQAFNLQACRQLGLSAVRRPTGGRAVLHADELTYAVVSNDLTAFGGSGIRETYLAIARVLREALRQIGCPADLSPGNIHRSDAKRSSIAEPCFVSTSRYEITAGGRKLVGSAQRRSKRAFLQHGSILLGCDYELQAQVLGTDTRTLRRSFAAVGEFAVGHGEETALRRAIPKAFREILAMDLLDGGLTQEESLVALHFIQMGQHQLGMKTALRPLTAVTNTQ